MCGTKGERHFISSSNTPHKGIKDLPGISLATSITKETSLVALEVSLAGNISHFTYFFQINGRSDLVDKMCQRINGYRQKIVCCQYNSLVTKFETIQILVTKSEGNIINSQFYLLLH